MQRTAYTKEGNVPLEHTLTVNAAKRDAKDIFLVARRGRMSIYFQLTWADWEHLQNVIYDLPDTSEMD